MTTTEYSDYAKDRSGWFFGLSGVQLSLVVLTGLPLLAALNSHRWLLVLGYLPIWAAGDRVSHGACGGAGRRRNGCSLSDYTP